MIQQTVKLCNTFLGYDPFGIVSLPLTCLLWHIIKFLTQAKQWVPLVEHELLSIPEDLNSPLLLFFIYLFFLFLMDLVVLDYLFSVLCLVDHYLPFGPNVVVTLSDRLQFAFSEYRYNIFKLFPENHCQIKLLDGMNISLYIYIYWLSWFSRILETNI
jgi:hypothetical protein